MSILRFQRNGQRETTTVPKPNERELLKAEFATRLGRLMSEKGWSQSDRARHASQFLPKGEEFRRDNVHVYLNQLALPRPKQRDALAKALGVDPEELLPGEGHTKNNMPVAMRAIPDEPGMAWLSVDKKVTMRTALAVLALLEDVR